MTGTCPPFIHQSRNHETTLAMELQCLFDSDPYRERAPAQYEFVSIVGQIEDGEVEHLSDTYMSNKMANYDLLLKLVIKEIVKQLHIRACYPQTLPIGLQ